MRIAVDAMGGDYAPREIVQGALAAVRELPVDIVLVGKEEEVKPYLPQVSLGDRLQIEHASEVIEMREPPVAAIRRKRDSSLGGCMRLVAEGKADAVVTAGNTGAAAALAHMKLKRIEGIDRPAIATVMPTAKDNVVLLDSGANVECRPKNLLEFALMGTVYARQVLGKDDPIVGILSIGEESEKGNELTKAAFELLSRAPINFHGNVEGRDIGLGNVDIVVCDGFVGNVVLKVAEGYALGLLKMMRESLLGAGLLARIGLVLLRRGFRDFKKRVDYTEYGGALLLGVNAVCVICHGSSNAHAIKNAINVARRAVEDRVVDHIRECLKYTQPMNEKYAA